MAFHSAFGVRDSKGVFADPDRRDDASGLQIRCHQAPRCKDALGWTQPKLHILSAQTPGAVKVAVQPSLTLSLFAIFFAEVHPLASFLFCPELPLIPFHLFSPSILLSAGFPDHIPSRPGFGQPEDELNETNVRTGYQRRFRVIPSKVSRGPLTQELVWQFLFWHLKEAAKEGVWFQLGD